VLWYKAWLETRSRFLASLCGMTAVVVLIVHHAEATTRPDGLSGAQYLARLRSNTGEIFNASQHIMIAIWILAVTLLGMGGLIRERAAGSSSFTLALPVSRGRLVSVSIAVGALEAVCLAVVPWTAVVITADLSGAPLLLSQAVFYVTLLLSGGLTYFGLSVLLASLIEGEYTAPAVAFGVTIVSGIVCGTVEAIRPYADLWRFMGGDHHFNSGTSVLEGPFPWAGALASLSVATILLLASVAVIRKAEF
jgi:ABC-2 type transport system permease protein